jgi:alkylhydroperoxidase family enzyme
MGLWPNVRREDVDEKYHKLVFDGTLKHEQNKSAGDREMIGLWGHSPEPLLHFGRLGLYLRWRSQLNPRLRQLAIVRTGALYEARYVYVYHCRMGIEHFGCSEEDMDIAIGRGSFPEGTIESDVIDLAQQMVTKGTADEKLVGRLTEAFGYQQCLDLMHSIGIYMHCSPVLNALQAQIEDEPGVQKYLERFGEIGVTPLNRLTEAAS